MLACCCFNDFSHLCQPEDHLYVLLVCRASGHSYLNMESCICLFDCTLSAASSSICSMRQKRLGPGGCSWGRGAFFFFSGPKSRGPLNLGKNKTNKHKESWRHTPWCASRLSRGHVPSVPVICPVCPGDILSP